MADRGDEFRKMMHEKVGPLHERASAVAKQIEEQDEKMRATFEAQHDPESILRPRAEPPSLEVIEEMVRRVVREELDARGL